MPAAGRVHAFKLSASRPTLIGVVHLPPLAATATGKVVARALSDAKAYVGAGMDAVLIENYGDTPFPKNRSPAHVAAMLAVSGTKVREELGVPVGFNVLRNDALSAVAACRAAGGSFIRVNVLAGAALTDQGLIEGEAGVVLRYGESIRADPLVLADVRVKHARPLVERPLEAEVEELFGRARADAVIVTGEATGNEADPVEFAETLKAAKGRPVLVGSGLTAANVRHYEGAAGFIVGTWCKKGGRTTDPVDPGRTKRFVAAARPRRR